MAVYRTRDESGVDEEITAETAEEAARAYVSSGDWAETAKTWWAYVWTVELDAEGDEVEDTRESHTIEVDPVEPACVEDEHAWDAPHASVGGLKESPGVRGHGGGVTIEEVCVHCGLTRVTDTWAQNPHTGEEGLTSVEYRENAFDVASLREGV